MKIECSKNKIEKALITANRVVSKNPTLPILSCVLLETKNNSLIIKATNLDVGVEIKIPAKVEKDGRVAINGSTIIGFLGGSGDDKDIRIESVGGNVFVKAKNGEAVIKGVSTEDFPEIPKVSDTTGLVVDNSIFSAGIRSVLYSASISHIKPELASVVVFGDGKELFFVSTDSFRLAEKKLPINNKKEIPQTIIPIKNAAEIARFSEEFENENTKLFVGKNQIAFESGDVYLVSRVVDGSFPDYKQIIPKDWKTEAVVLKEDLLKALKTIVVFSDTFNQMTINIMPEKKKIEFKTKNNDVGESFITIPAAISGEEISVSFNHRYISDCLSSINSDSVSLSFFESTKPTMIRGVRDNSFMYIVMPMNR